MCHVPEKALVNARFWLVAAIGGSVALFGVVANGMLAKLFVTNSHYRHSPFFFLGFVAVFDTLLDLVYILLLTTPIIAEYTESYQLYVVWMTHAKPLYFLGQCFKISSVFCLIVASFERYMMTRHWTFSGFEYRTRWIILFSAITLGIIIKVLTAVNIVVIMRTDCIDRFSRYTIGQLTKRSWFGNFLNMLTIFLPFFTLVFFNGGIVLMLKKQNVQQLRSLLTELTLGRDISKLRRRNLKIATNTLLVIISAYLISNSFNLFLSLFEYLYPGVLQQQWPYAYRLGSDGASMLTIFGNALRCPAHFISNKEIRTQFRVMLLGEPKKKPPLTLASMRRKSERIDNPWLSVLTTARDNTEDDGDAENEATESKKLAPKSRDSLSFVFNRDNFRRISSVDVC